jgi:hypothetical protein
LKRDFIHQIFHAVIALLLLFLRDRRFHEDRGLGKYDLV